MRHGKRDANHAVIVDYMRQCGWHVLDTADVGPNAIPGFPDVWASLVGVTVGIEIKDGAGKLTQEECDFWTKHGQAFRLEMVRTSADVLALTRKVLAGDA